MYTAKPLGDGRVASSITAIYECPTGVRATVEVLTYYNTSASANTVLTYLNVAGTQRGIDSHSVAATSRYICVDKTAPIHMDPGDILYAYDGVGNEVDYHVFGQEEQKG